MSGGIFRAVLTSVDDFVLVKIFHPLQHLGKHAVQASLQQMRHKDDDQWPSRSTSPPKPNRKGILFDEAWRLSRKVTLTMLTIGHHLTII
jgi:hypothetical protein